MLIVLHVSSSFAPNAVTDASINSKWLYNFVADEWSNWLPQSALDTLRNGGYYTFIIKPRLRVVALNNNLCFTFNMWVICALCVWGARTSYIHQIISIWFSIEFSLLKLLCFVWVRWLHYGSEEMRKQLQWLHDTLLSAEVAGESVHILGHVPPSTASCVHSWNREYDKIVRRFAHIISGQFFGHTHRDEFNVFYLKEGNSQNAAVNVAWNAGSGTTFTGFNSNYRIYHAEPTKYVRLSLSCIPHVLFQHSAGIVCIWHYDTLLIGNNRPRHLDFQLDRS